MLLPVGETTVIDRILGELEEDDRITACSQYEPRFVSESRDHIAASRFEEAP